MTIKDLTNNYEKTINPDKIDFIDCQPRNNPSYKPEYKYQYTVWTDTFCHVFKTKTKITDNGTFEAIETYSFSRNERDNAERQINLIKEPRNNE